MKTGYMHRQHIYVSAHTGILCTCGKRMPVPATGSPVDKKTTNAAGSSSCELFNQNCDIALNCGLGVSRVLHESGGRFIRELEWGTK